MSKHLWGEGLSWEEGEEELPSDSPQAIHQVEVFILADDWLLVLYGQCRDPDIILRKRCPTLTQLMADLAISNGGAGIDHEDIGFSFQLIQEG